MSLKNAALFALIGMALLTIVLAVGFIRDVSALMAGAVAAITVLTSFIRLLASFSVAVFFYLKRTALTFSAYNENFIGVLNFDSHQKHQSQEWS